MSGINTCKICNNNISNTSYVAKEMMYGMLDEFEYFECSKCGCVQIRDIPENLEKYYADDYYSYQETNNTLGFKDKLKISRRKFLIQIRLKGDKFFTNYFNPYHWIQKDFLNFESNILDIGCGAGNLLKDMNRFGFKKLTGVDPFISKDIHYENGITIHKKFVHEIEGRFDFIMLHHSFEHMDNPLETLKNIRKLLNDKGFILVAIPVANSFAWRKYGINWIQLDPPRHLFLHTTQSIQLLCEQSGLKLKKILFDSSEFQFMGSEMYLRNIPLDRGMSHLFNKKEMLRYRKEAKRLNEIQDGDSACFYLEKQ